MRSASENKSFFLQQANRRETPSTPCKSQSALPATPGVSTRDGNWAFRGRPDLVWPLPGNGVLPSPGHKGMGKAWGVVVSLGLRNQEICQAKADRISCADQRNLFFLADLSVPVFSLKHLIIRTTKKWKWKFLRKIVEAG